MIAKCVVAIAVLVGGASVVAKRSMDREALSTLVSLSRGQVYYDPEITGGLATRKPR